MRKIPTTHLTAEELGLPRARFLPTLLTLALIGSAASYAKEVSYQHYRFTATKNFNTTTTTEIQLSEFNFGLRGTLLNLNGSTGVGASIPVAVSGGTNVPTADEGALKMTDGSLDTKVYNGNRTLPFLFSFDGPVTVDSYNFATANDSNDRTPVSWTLEGSNDGLNFTVIDTRTDVGITNYYKTYQSGWTIPATALPAFPTFSVTQPGATPTYETASPGIVKSGVATNLSWDVTGATIGPVILNPGYVSLTDSGSQDVTPPAGLTPYTLSATNDSGTSSSTINLRSVPGGSATYQYWRFTPVSLRYNPDATTVQLGEFEFFNQGNEQTVAFASNAGGNNPDGEGPANLIDGNPETKWLDGNKKAVVFDFPSAVTIDSYQFVTGNDADDRDPVRWTLEGSNNLSDWVLVDAVTGADYPTPLRRVTATGQLPLSGRALAWKGGINGTWDTTTANFNPMPGSATTTTFADNESVSFSDGASTLNVVLSAPHFPSHVVFYNETSNYTLSGSPINGPTQLVKNGAGTVTLGSANNFTGQITVAGGTLVSQAATAIGPRYISTPVELRDGGKLTAGVTQSSSRILNVASGLGGSVEVPSGVTFTHYDKINMSGTLTKTGAGTLRFENYSGSTSGAAEDMIINEGVVEFTEDRFNGDPLGSRSFKATVNAGGILRTTVSHALGGDYIDGNTSVEQLSAIGGTLQFNNHTYLATGLVGGIGRTVLQGGVMEGVGQVESGDFFLAAPDNQIRSTITSLASATTSEIRGAGVLNCNVAHWVFAVENGAAQDDLLISKEINGNYGIIKDGDGNLVLTNVNTYAGSTSTATKLPMPDGTTVRGGTLTVRNDSGSATGPGTVLVQSGATLAGSGFITGASNIAGTVSPGEAGTGTLTLGTTGLSGGNYLCNVNGVNTDKLVVNGDLNLTNATLTIAPIGAGATEATYVIASYSGNLTGSFNQPIVGLPSGYSLSHNAAAKQLELKVSSGTGYHAWSAGLSDPSSTADIDHDGLVNGIEFVIGSSATVPGREKAPTALRNASGDLVFTFRRTNASAYLQPGVEYSTSLTGTWTPAPSNQVAVTINTPESGVDTVVVTLPASLAQGGKLFARLRVDIP